MFEQSVELAVIDMDKSLSVQIKCVNTIILFFLSCSTIRTTNLHDYCTYIVAIWVSFNFLDLELAKCLKKDYMYSLMFFIN